MKTFLFEAFITLKEKILDPQGVATEKVLKRLNYPVKNVRFGKLITFEVSGESLEMAEKIASEMTHKVLINPVLETYKLKLIKELEDD